jgi:hypothetical protein
MENLPFYLYFYSLFTQRKIFNIFRGMRKRKKEELKKAFFLQTKRKVVETQNL